MGRIVFECGVSCLGASFLWGELSWGELSLGRVVLIPFWVTGRFGTKPFWPLDVLAPRQFGPRPFWQVVQKLEQNLKLLEEKPKPISWTCSSQTALPQQTDLQ